MKKEIQKKLFALQDISYKKFHCGLMPTVDPTKVIGVRMPELRKLAKDILKSGRADEFTEALPHEYYEENNLHGIIIGTEKNFDAAIVKVERLLPYVDNWATCDLLDFAAFKNHKVQLHEKAIEWMASDNVYTVRFGIKMLMTYFLDSDFSPEQLKIVSKIESEEYYVNMMRAWYFATALAKQYEETVKLIECDELDLWTHNKTIQKAIESYRISDEHKLYLRTLRRKEKGNA